MSLHLARNRATPHPSRRSHGPVWLLLALSLLALACDRSSQGEALAQTKQASEAKDGVQMDSPFGRDSSPSPLQVTEKFEDPDFSLTTERATLCKQTGPFVPKEGMKRYSVPVVVEATGRRSVPLSTLAFRLVDGNGNLYGATLAGCEKPLGTQTLVSGTKASGAIAFDVPEEVRELQIQFEPFLIGRPKVSARAKVALPSAVD